MQLTLQSSLWDQDDAKLLLKPHLCLASSPAHSLPYSFPPSASQQDICVRITFTGTAPRTSRSDETLKGYSRSRALIMPCIAAAQISSVAQSWLTLRPHGLQLARLPCPITNSRSLLKLMAIESVMPSNHLVLCCPLLLLPLIFPRIRCLSQLV